MHAFQAEKTSQKECFRMWVCFHIKLRFKFSRIKLKMHEKLYERRKPLSGWSTTSLKNLNSLASYKTGKFKYFENKQSTWGKQAEFGRNEYSLLFIFNYHCDSARGVNTSVCIGIRHFVSSAFIFLLLSKSWIIFCFPFCRTR